MHSVQILTAFTNTSLKPPFMIPSTIRRAESIKAHLRRMRADFRGDDRTYISFFSDEGAFLPIMADTIRMKPKAMYTGAKDEKCAPMTEGVYMLSSAPGSKDKKMESAPEIRHAQKRTDESAQMSRIADDNFFMNSFLIIIG